MIKVLQKTFQVEEKEAENNDIDLEAGSDDFGITDKEIAANTAEKGQRKYSLTGAHDFFLCDEELFDKLIKLKRKELKRKADSLSVYSGGTI